LTFVALAGDEPVGMCSLRENDGIKPDFIYKQLSEDALSKMGWLGTLVVTSAYQKQGIAQTLIDAVKNKAQELGLEKLYLFAFDPTIPEYYARLGWRTIGTDEFADKPVTVMELCQ
jgi:N-acetylglutamate synthase-like GNAT family acetyltransferase